MRYYLISGEASGDLHGSNLIYALKKKDSEANFRYWGGDKMKKAGGKLVKHYKETAFMGFGEVVKHLPKIFQNLKFCKKDILSYKPDALILIDYPGFNLRIARFAKKHQIKVFYYISPQIWAWKESRINTIKKCVYLMFVILPFEKAFYNRHNYEVNYVGHPLLEELEKYTFDKIDFFETNKLPEKPIIALLPGSREQEVKKNMNIMVNLCDQFKDYHFIVAATDSINPSFYYGYQKTNLSVLFNQAYNILSAASAGVITSGTATLEAALLNLPMVVCYKTSFISYWIGKWLIKVPYISLVNLILNKPVVTELIQHSFTSVNAGKELKKILNNPKQFNSDYNQLKKLLKNEENASVKVAETIVKKSTIN